MYNIYVDGRKTDFEYNIEKAVATANKSLQGAKFKVVIKNEAGNIVWQKKPS